MHNPEVVKFPAPECRLTHSWHSWEGGERSSWHWLVDQHPFNTKVSLLLPDSPNIPSALRELLTEDTQFYRITNLPLHELCAPAFLQAFLNKGEVFALTCDTRLDLDNSAALTPDGLLRLLVDKFTYQELRLSGVLSTHILRKPRDRFVIEVNLKQPSFTPGKPHYHKVTTAFQELQLGFNFWLLWMPDDADVCPSSIAKYFHDLGYSVEECDAVMGHQVMTETLMPSLKPTQEHESISKSEETDPEDVLEWIGCQALGIQLSSEVTSVCGLVKPKTGIPVSNLCNVHCSGFFPPSHIHLIIQHLRLWMAQRDASAVPWVSLTVYGHPDSPISWGRQEHSFRTTGDNLYTVVLLRDCLYLYQLQGSSRPQRLYVKTNKNK